MRKNQLLTTFKSRRHHRLQSIFCTWYNLKLCVFFLVAQQFLIYFEILLVSTCIYILFFRYLKNLKEILNLAHNFLCCAKYIYKNFSSTENQAYMLDIFFTTGSSKILLFSSRKDSFSQIVKNSEKKICNVILISFCTTR